MLNLLAPDSTNKSSEQNSQSSRVPCTHQRLVPAFSYQVTRINKICRNISILPRITRQTSKQEYKLNPVAAQIISVHERFKNIIFN